MVFSNFMGLHLAMAQTKLINKYGLTVINLPKFCKKRSNGFNQLSANMAYYLPGSSSFELTDISFATLEGLAARY